MQGICHHYAARNVLDQSKQMQLCSARCNRQSRGVVHQFIRYGSLTWLWNFVEVHYLQQETELHLLLWIHVSYIGDRVGRICRADNGGRLNFNAVIAVRRSRYLKHTMRMATFIKPVV